MSTYTHLMIYMYIFIYKIKSKYHTTLEFNRILWKHANFPLDLKTFYQNFKKNP